MYTTILLTTLCLLPIILACYLLGRRHGAEAVGIRVNVPASGDGSLDAMLHGYHWLEEVYVVVQKKKSGLTAGAKKISQGRFHATEEDALAEFDKLSPDLRASFCVAPMLVAVRQAPLSAPETVETR